MSRRTRYLPAMTWPSSAGASELGAASLMRARRSLADRRRIGPTRRALGTSDAVPRACIAAWTPPARDARPGRWPVPWSPRATRKRPAAGPPEAAATAAATTVDAARRSRRARPTSSSTRPTSRSAPTASPTGELGLADKIAVFLNGRPDDRGHDGELRGDAQRQAVARRRPSSRRCARRRPAGAVVKTDARDGSTQSCPLVLRDDARRLHHRRVDRQGRGDRRLARRRRHAQARDQGPRRART